MIYKATFKMKNIAVKLISSVIFGNIARIIFELFSEEEAQDLIKDMVFKDQIRISDAVTEDLFKMRNDKEEKEYLIENLINGEEYRGKGLIEEREKYREYKTLLKKDEEKILEIPRIRVGIDRKNLKAEDNKLYYQNEYWSNKEMFYTIYIYTENEHTIKLLEIVLNILERTGMGTDTTIGCGDITFFKERERLLIKEKNIKLVFKEEGAINIASTIVDSDYLKDINIQDYVINRYDSKSPKITKPPYYYMERGCFVHVQNPIPPQLKEYKGIWIYNCVFPVERRKL